MRDYDATVKNLREAAKGLLFDAMPYRASVMQDAADAIEELLEEKAKLENSGKLLVAAFDRLKEKVQKYRHAAFVISETCVDESKSHISPEDAIKKIREHIYYDNTESCTEPPKEDDE